MTKGKKANKKEKAKRVNNTTHQRALENPKTRASLSALRDGWDNMIAKKRGEQLIELIGLGCSVRGIARDLIKPEINLRREIALAKSPEPDSGWVGMMNATIAKRPPKQEKELSRIDASREARALFKKRVRQPIITPARSMKIGVPSPATQPPQKHSFSPSTKAEADPIANRSLNGRERKSAEHEPKPDLVAQFVKLRNEGSNAERMQRLQGIVDSIDRRPILNARSMSRQGKPLRKNKP